MNFIKCLICENYLWVLSALTVLFVAFIWVIIISNKKRKRFLVWKREKINLWIYSSEREYGKDDVLQELYDENIRLDKENKILKKQVSDSSFLGIVILFLILLALWFKRNKKDKKDPDNNPSYAHNDTSIEIEDNNCYNGTTK